MRDFNHIPSEYAPLYKDVLEAVTKSSEAMKVPIASKYSAKTKTEEPRYDCFYFHKWVSRHPNTPEAKSEFTTGVLKVITKSQWDKLSVSGLTNYEDVEKIFEHSAKTNQAASMLDYLRGYLSYVQNTEKVRLFGVIGHEKAVESLLFARLNESVENSETSLSDSIFHDSLPADALVTPFYISAKNALEDDNISLSPYDHYSIPLFGRDTEIDLLDEFLSKDDPFLIFPIVGPSGSGKTRLVTQWHHEKVNRSQWASGLVESSSPLPWIEWTPTCDTIIIIDYIYRFDGVIHQIEKRCREASKTKVRLIILDHVFPSDLQELRQDSISRSAFAQDRKYLDFVKSKFFPTLFLEKSNARHKILQEIVAEVSGEEQNSSEVREAVELLENMGLDKERITANSEQVSSAAHPLFAILVAQALADPAYDISEWRRQDLVDYYLNTRNRLPWIPAKAQSAPDSIGKWVGAFVAAATVRRGASFDFLFGCIPPTEELDGQTRDRIRAWCNRIVSSNDTEHLKYFDPDILGEHFFLLFFRHFMFVPTVYNAFVVMLCGKDKRVTIHPQEDGELSKRFIEFIQRLARNLANDDQATYEIQSAWRTLRAFLHSDVFSSENLGEITKSIAIIAVSDALRSKKLLELEEMFLAHLDTKIIVSEILEGDNEELEIAYIKYFDRTYSDFRQDSSEIENLIRVSKDFKRRYKYEDVDLYALASVFGCINVVKALAQSIKSSPDTTYRDRTTPLICAAAHGHVELVDYLASTYKVSVDTMNIRCGTALHYACLNGHLNVVNCLIGKHQARMFANKSEIYPVGYASYNGHFDVLDTLISKYNSGLGETGNTFGALTCACSNGQMDVVDVLISKYGANVEYQDHKGRTALQWAAYYGHLDIVNKLIVNYGAKVDQIDHRGRTAMQWAAYFGHLDIVDTLITIHKANVDHKDNRGRAAITLAYFNGHWDVMKSLRTIHGCSDQ